MKITHMGVSFHGITWAEEGQRAIETFMMAAPSRPVSTKDRARSVSVSVGVRDVDDEPAKVVDIGQKRKRRSVSVTPFPQDKDVDIIDVDQGECTPTVAASNSSAKAFPNFPPRFRIYSLINKKLD